MSIIPMRAKRIPRATASRKARRVYAIAFDLDTAAAERHCGPSWRGCYEKISTVFAEFGFARVQGSVYFGDETSDGVQCVLAVQAGDRRNLGNPDAQKPVDGRSPQHHPTAQ